MSALSNVEVSNFGCFSIRRLGSVQVYDFEKIDEIVIIIITTTTIIIIIIIIFYYWEALRVP